jgi:hypothetical protein
VNEGVGTEKIQALKFPRHCPLVLLVGVCWREGKAMGSGPCYEYKTEGSARSLLHSIGIFILTLEGKFPIHYWKGVCVQILC